MREITAEPDDKKRYAQVASIDFLRTSFAQRNHSDRRRIIRRPANFRRNNRGFGWQRCGWENRDVATTLPIERGLILHNVDGPFIRVDARASREKSGID